MAEKVICANHFADNFIKQHIRNNNGKIQKCYYCEKKRKCHEIQDLASFIEDCINIEYDDPYSRGAAYDKEAENYEDRFPGVTVYRTIEVLENEPELTDDDEFEIIEDISRCFSNNYWSEIDGIWGPTSYEFMRNGWDSFKQIIKHKVRWEYKVDCVNS